MNNNSDLTSLPQNLGIKIVSSLLSILFPIYISFQELFISFYVIRLNKIIGLGQTNGKAILMYDY